MSLFKRKQGNLTKMAAKNAPVLIPAISPDIQGVGAYRLLDTEQKAILHYALKDFKKTEGLTTCSIEACISGTGSICWAFEKKTRFNRNPALKLWPRKVIKVDFITRAKRRLRMA
ncbi:hypothetical protein LCGC14_2490930 [marine sediment metagenome]|uniref:Uncharacterized protein n=1 Tax=marine sediment metagenome TaxID=412755 RepID=A0A0F9DGL1_9ZZZZ